FGWRRRSGRGRSGGGSSRFVAAMKLFLRMLSRLLFGGFACVFFGLAFGSRFTLDLEAGFLDSAMARFFFCALARFLFIYAGAGKRFAARGFLFIGQLAQDHAAR